jgi:putative ABC transport system ATP-binding protein
MLIFASMFLGLENATLSFDGRTLFEKITFGIEKGKRTGLRGRSGCGKSSLMMMMMGFIQPETGRLIYKGQSMTPALLRQFRRESGWLPQQLPLSDIPVMDFLIQPFAYNANSLLRPEASEIKKMAEGLFQDEEVLGLNMQELSGGQRQRIGILRLLLLKRPLLFLDEPSSALDEGNRNRIMNFLAATENTSIVLATHEPSLLDWCDHVADIEQISRHGSSS